jgi:hypothetical protein
VGSESGTLAQARGEAGAVSAAELGDEESTGFAELARPRRETELGHSPTQTAR